MPPVPTEPVYNAPPQPKGSEPPSASHSKRFRIKDSKHSNALTVSNPECRSRIAGGRQKRRYLAGARAKVVPPSVGQACAVVVRPRARVLLEITISLIREIGGRSSSCVERTRRGEIEFAPCLEKFQRYLSKVRLKMGEALRKELGFHSRRGLVRPSGTGMRRRQSVRIYCVSLVIQTWVSRVSLQHVRKKAIDAVKLFQSPSDELLQLHHQARDTVVKPRPSETELI